MWNMSRNLPRVLLANINQHYKKAKPNKSRYRTPSLSRTAKLRSYKATFIEPENHAIQKHMRRVWKAHKKTLLARKMVTRKLKILLYC